MGKLIDLLTNIWADRVRVTLALSALALYADAHHSDAPHFYLDQHLVLEGVVTEFRFVNPHAYVYF